MKFTFTHLSTPRTTESSSDTSLSKSPKPTYTNILFLLFPQITIPCWTFLAKHITMKGTLIFADSDMEEVIAMMAAGKLAGYEKLVTGRIALDDIVKEGFEELVNHKDEHIKILVTPNRRRDSITE